MNCRKFWPSFRTLAVFLLVVQMVAPPMPAVSQAVGPSATVTVNPVNGFTGDTFTYSGQLVSRAAGTTFTLAFGDGTTQMLPTPATLNTATSYTATHVFTTAGNQGYTITATPGGIIARGTVPVYGATVTATTAAPVMQVPTAFGYTSTVAAGAVAGNFAVSYGDGTANGTAPIAATGTFSHTYLNAGTYTVTLLSPSGNKVATTSVTVAPLAMTISATPAPVQAGNSTAITFTPATRVAATPTVNIAFGDGATTTAVYTTSTINHTYATPGTYTVTATVGTTRIGTLSITAVTSTFAMATNPDPSLAGGVVTLTTTATVPAGAVPPNLVLLSYGDGTGPVTIPFSSATYTHTYATRGTFTLTASNGNAVNYATATQTVLQPGATVSAQNGVVNQPDPITIMVTALGAQTGPNLIVAFGDGNTQTIPYATTTLNHTYTAPGSYTITVTPVAAVGAVAAPYATTSITVSAPMLTMAASPNPALAGSTVQLTLSVSGTNMSSPPPLTINYGDGTAAVTTPFASSTLAHVYAAPGTFTITATASGVQVASTTEQVVAPSATLAVTPNPVVATQNATFALTVGSLGAVTGPNLVVNYGDGTAPQTVPYANATLTHAFATAGTYQVTVTPAGATTALATTAVTVTSPTTVTIAGNPNPSLAGTAVTFTMTVVGGNSTQPLTVNFGDGQSASTFPASTTLTHTYAAAGTFTVTVVSGTATLATTTQRVVAPSATITGSPNPAAAGTSVTFTLGVGNLGGLAGPNLNVNYGDGTAVQTVPYAAATLTHTFSSGGGYTVTVTAAGQNAPLATTQESITATAGATLTANPNPALAGSTVTFNLTVTGAGTGGLTISYGDGATQTTTFTSGTFTHAYAAAGTYTVSVVSSAQTQTLYSLTETVVAPSATLSSAPNPVVAGQAATITLGVGSLGAVTGPNLVLNFGDGSATQTVPYANATFNHVYATGGTYTVSVTPVNGTAPLATTQQTAVAASNVTLASGSNPSYAGSSVNFTLTVTGTGAGALTVSYGDGSAPQTVPFQNATLTHTYAAAGSYTVTVSSATGQLASLTQRVVALSATLVPSPNPGLQGSAVSFALGVGPATAGVPPSLTVNYGDGTAPVTVPYAATTLTHTYTSAGVFTVVVSTPSVTAPLATVSETISTPMVMLGATPNPQLAGKSISFALTVNAINSTLAPMLIVNYGDGSAPVTVPFAATTLAHTYAVAGNFTATVSSPNSAAPLYSLPVVIVTPGASLVASPNPALVDSTVSFALGVAALSGLTGPNLTVNYGDGSAPQTVPYAATTLNHAYTAAGTFTTTVTGAGSTALLTSTNVTVEAPSATLNVTPNPQLINQPVTVALNVTALARAAALRNPKVTVPNLTLDFGDGSAAQSVAYTSASYNHAYAKAGSYTIRVTDPTGSVNATQVEQIVTAGATLMVAPNPVMAGGSTGITVMVTQLGNLVAPTPLTVNFGDGSSQQIAYATATIQHVYAKTGTYTVTVTAPDGTVFSTAVATVVAQAQNLALQTPTVNSGQAAQILVTLTPPAGFAAAPELLTYGDGTQTTVRTTGVYPHAYGAPGIYTVTLKSPVTGTVFSTASVTVNGIAPRVPIGSVFGTTFTLSPILAGDRTDVIVQFTVATPALASIADPIYAFVDLTTTKGKLINRSDLFEIQASQYSGPGVKTVKIPYDTPIDAAGTYLVKVTLMSAQGGTITTGQPATLIIIGGPDPLPKVQTDFHSTGSVEVGPHAGQPGVTFDPGMTNALLFPTNALNITGLFDPVSHRVDPVFAVKSGAPPQQVVAAPAQTPAPEATGKAAPQAGATVPAAPLPTPPGPLNGGALSGANAYTGPLQNLPSPVPGTTATPKPGATAAGTVQADTGLATPTPAPTAAAAEPTPAPQPPQPNHPYTEIYGRGQATLPALLGGSTTLRGLDLVDSTGAGPTTYQVGYGDTIVGTPTTSAERGTVADIARSFAGTGVARVTYFGRQDDPVTYAPQQGTTGPLVANAEVFEFTSPAFGPLTLTATGGISEAHSLTQNYRADDAADKFTLAFQKPAYNFTFDYHNAGSLFAVGGGPGASSDRVGFASASTIQLYTVASLALGYSKDETRSAFSRQSDAFVTFNFTLPKQNTLQVGVKRDTQRTPTSDTDNDTTNFNLGGHLGIATVSLNGSLTATRDYIAAINGTTTRTLSAQFAVQQNAHALGLGINATDLSGAAPNATVGESLTYGFPFFGHLENGVLVHGFELQLSATNTNSHSPGAGAADEGLSAILSYHINPHLAFGVRNEYTWHVDSAKLSSTKASALRLRLDLTQ